MKGRESLRHNERKRASGAHAGIFLRQGEGDGAAAKGSRHQSMLLALALRESDGPAFSSWLIRLHSVFKVLSSTLSIRKAHSALCRAPERDATHFALLYFLLRDWRGQSGRGGTSAPAGGKPMPVRSLSRQVIMLASEMPKHFRTLLHPSPPRSGPHPTAFSDSAMRHEPDLKAFCHFCHLGWRCRDWKRERGVCYP